LKAASFREIRFDAVVIHYGEITLKRSKRGLFERMLHRNLRRLTGLPVRRLQGRFVIDLSPEIDLERLLERLGKVFGVVWYAPAVRADTLEEIQERISEAVSVINPESIKVDTRRSDKSFPITSIEISRRIGKFLSSRLGVEVDLKNPELRIFVELTEDGIYASFEKLRGPGGLPLGSSGRVLGLFSGGSHSALACWFMMKRGCAVDLLHVHSLSSGEEVLKTEFKSAVDKLLEYSMKLRLYLAPSTPFMDRARDAPETARPLLFKGYLIRVGELLAERRGYPGLVLGERIEKPEDAEEVGILLSGRSLPIYTPLLALPEDEIHKKIELLELRSEYSDPLSGLGAGRGKCSAKEFERLWRRLELGEAAGDAADAVEVYLADLAGFRRAGS